MNKVNNYQCMDETHSECWQFPTQFSMHHFLSQHVGREIIQNSEMNFSVLHSTAVSCRRWIISCELSLVVSALHKDIMNRCSSCQQKSRPLKINDFRSLSVLHVSVSTPLKQINIRDNFYCHVTSG